MRDEASSQFLAFQEAVVGRYSLDREIGRGGMGVVFLAHEVALDRPVALKVMPPEYAVQPALRERFLREARTAAKLSHPNIVPIHAVDEAGDFVFFAMAFVQGETLGQRVRDRGPPSSREAVKILQEVSWALAYAHAEGVIHRDVKPDNILLEDGSGRALVTDFGIASVQTGEGLTTQGEVLGTAEFMSPEQASGEDVGPASDIYSLGVVAYYTLSGALPFQGSSVASVLAKHLTQPAPRLASVVPEAPAHLADAVDRCLAKEPADRFEDAAQLAEALATGMVVRGELPVPLRVFVRSMRELGTSAPLIVTLWLVIGVLVGRAEVAEWPLAVLAMLGVLAVGPLAILAYSARRLLEAGYTLEDGRLALQEDLERRAEEIRFEFHRGPNWIDRGFRWLSAGGFLTALGSVAVGATMGIDLLAPFITGLNLGLFSGFAALFRAKGRRDWIGQLSSWLVKGTLGTWAFSLGKLGLDRRAIGAGGAHRPTEMAISLAADRLFEELPRELRRELNGLPATVGRLEADARSMRRQVEQLDGVLAEIGDDARVEDAERMALRADLERTRDAARTRMTEAIAAMEKIRLKLLRLHAGDGTVESLTMELGSASELSRVIDRLLEGQRDVARLLRPPELRTDP